MRTVESHRARILRKLGLSPRAELVRFAADHGLLDLDFPPDAYAASFLDVRDLLLAKLDRARRLAGLLLKEPDDDTWSISRDRETSVAGAERNT